MAPIVTEKKGRKRGTPKSAPSRTLMDATFLNTEDDDGDDLNPRDYVNSVARGLEVLRAFNRVRRQMTLSEVAAETGNSRAAARRILLTLVREGYAVTDGKFFDLTPQVLELGYSVLLSKGIWDIARPFIGRLSEEIQESVSAAILDNFEVVYVSCAEYHRIITVGVTVGARYPAHLTATGRVLLAAQPKDLWPGILRRIPLHPMTEHTVTDRKTFRQILEEVRKQGWCIVDQELEVGLISIAVPLYNGADKLIGAINVGVPIIRMSRQRLEEFVLPKLIDTAEKISQALRR